MLAVLHEKFVRPLVQRWLSRSDSSWRLRESPAATGSISIEGPDPDRLLLMGGGISVGWGTASHDQALAGHLARGISAATDRGATVEVIVDDILSDSAPLASGLTRSLRTFDAVIITPGDIDVLLLLPPAVYRQRIEAVLDVLDDLSAANTQLFVVGLVPLTTVVTLPRLLGWFTTRLAMSLDEQAQLACVARKRSSFVTLSARQQPDPGEVCSSYETWAKMIVPRVNERLTRCEGNAIR